MKLGVWLATLCVVAVGWQVLAFVLGDGWWPGLAKTASYFVSSAMNDAVLEREGAGDGGFLPHATATVLAFLASVSLGCLAGALIAAIAVGSGIVGASLERILEFVRTLPPLIFVPFLLLAYGASHTSVFLTGLLYATVSFFFYWLAGLRSVAASYIEQAKVFGAGNVTIWHTVLVPASLPAVLGGLRVTGGLTLGIVIVAEYLGGPSGLGRTLKCGVAYSSALMLFVGVLWAVGIGVVYDILIGLVTRRALGWKIAAPTAMR